MSVLRDGDEPLHYEDGSHRWTGPDSDDDAVWRVRVEGHIEEHRRRPGEGRPVRGADRRSGRRPPTEK